MGGLVDVEVAQQPLEGRRVEPLLRLDADAGKHVAHQREIVHHDLHDRRASSWQETKHRQTWAEEEHKQQATSTMVNRQEGHARPLHFPTC